MPTTIPDSMPADWLDDGAEVRGTTPDDTALRTAMQAAYREGLDRLGVAGIMGSLKDLCMAAAKPQEAEGAETVTNPPEGVSNHHLTPESIKAGSSAT